MEVKGSRGSIAFDGKQVTIRKSMQGTVTVTVDQIGAVEITRAGLGMMQIRFAVAGSAGGTRQTVLGSYAEARTDPYSLPFWSRQRPAFEALRDAINAAR